MTDLNTLHDAFTVLEHRADTALATAPEFAFAPVRHRTSRVLAPAVAVAAVVATAGGVALWQSGSDGNGHAAGPAPISSTRPGTAPTTSPTVAPTPVPTSSPAAGPSGVPTPASTAPGGHYVAPSTPNELAARARSILAGIATITVVDDGGTSGVPIELPTVPTGTPTSSAGSAPLVSLPAASATPPLPSSDGAPDSSPSGSAIRGTLTADGRSGGYDLNVFATHPGSAAGCDADTDCTVRRLPDGASLAVSTWHDPETAGGITYQVEVVRQDGAEILLHLSTEKDPKGQSTVSADRMPLSRQQMIDFVTSDRW